MFGKKTASEKPGAKQKDDKAKAPKAGNPTKARRGTLLILAAFLMGSGFIRVGIGAESAMAQSDETAPETPSNSAPECITQAGVLSMLDELNARASKLDEREALLGNRQAAIDMAESQLTKQIEEMQVAEAELARTVEIADRGATDDVARLVTLYENMKPKQAVPLFETMAPEFAAGFLAQMEPASAAAIMAGLTPDTAYTISVMMAGRNAQAQK
ncbi:hypothetical protein ERN12_11110 [Rhodobacteraceae bacterium]|nr:hypothetical protein ERN12_11110 [Paracoccaceae bacterium]